MHLYSRQGVFTGAFGDLMGWATSITSHASGLLGTEIGLWSAGFGAPSGTLGWSFPVDGLSGVAANTEKLLADEQYHEMLVKGQDFVMAGSVQDSITRVIHGQVGEQRPPIGSVATITTATMNAPWADVIAWGVGVAQLVESINGTPIMFGSSAFGTFGQVGWIGVSLNAADADAQNEKLLANAEYIAKVGESNALFVPGSGHRTFMTRVG